MNARQLVKLTADANYVPVMYSVVSATIGNTPATSYLWLEVVGYGILNTTNLDLIRNNPSNPNTGLLIGTKGAYSVVPLSNVSEYVAPTSLVVGAINIGKASY